MGVKVQHRVQTPRLHAAVVLQAQMRISFQGVRTQSLALPMHAQFWAFQVHLRFSVILPTCAQLPSTQSLLRLCLNWKDGSQKDPSCAQAQPLRFTEETKTPNFAKKPKHDTPVGKVVEDQIVVDRHCKKNTQTLIVDSTSIIRLT
jgi:hypothetical protein